LRKKSAKSGSSSVSRRPFRDAPELLDELPPGKRLKRYAREFLFLWRLGLARLLTRWWMVLLIVAVGAALVLVSNGADDSLLHRIRQPENGNLTRAATWLSYWGDVRWAAIIAVGLFVLGATCGCPRWRHICHACIIATIVSTVVVNVFRPTLGRARPYSELPGNFYGPHLDSKYHGFPSGHATSAFAAAAAIGAASPLIGAPCLLFAGGVSWSRMQLNRHHPLDVLTGAALGTFLGLCCGSAVPGARFRLRRKKRRIS
jgi:membrane-associated phospholipid phosphatase